MLLFKFAFIAKGQEIAIGLTTGIHPPCKLGKDNPKTVIVVTIVGIVVVAISHTAVRGIVVPAATAQNTIRTFLDYYSFFLKHIALKFLLSAFSANAKSGSILL